MGTRADFYIGRGETAEWLGSIAWDGYPEGLEKALLSATDKETFLAQVKLLADRRDWTSPERGWPWPWDDSQTTDYAYAFDGGKVWASSFGHEWFDPLLPVDHDENSNKGKCAVFPNMKSKQNVAMDGRSGLLIIGG